MEEGQTVAELTSLEICAGAGGQAIGLEQAGFTHEAVVELDAAACETLRRNRGDAWKVIEDDVANVDGRGFEKEANRPTNLQIPLFRDI